MTDRNAWNMARIASARPLPKPFKMNTSVVGSVYRRFPAFRGDRACKACGMHVCAPLCTGHKREQVVTVAQEPSQAQVDANIGSAFTCCGNSSYAEHSTGCRFHPANPITKAKTAWGKAMLNAARAAAGKPKSVNRDRIGCDECGGLRIHAIGCKREPAQYNGY